MVENARGEIDHSYPQTILYAGESPRRTSFLTHVFPKSELYTFSVEPEPHTDDVVAVVNHKLDLGLDKLGELSLNGTRDRSIIVAADIRTLTAHAVNNGGFELRSTSKLESTEEVKRNLLRMAESFEEKGEKPFYIVDIASGSHSIADNRRKTARGHSYITLDDQSLKDLITNEGFEKYIARFNQFYSEPPYSTHNLPALSLTDISAGLSLPVLTQMGVLDSLNGVSRDDADAFRRTFAQELFKVGVGFDLSLFSNASIDIRDWSWLNQVTDKVLPS